MYGILRYNRHGVPTKVDAIQTEFGIMREIVYNYEKWNFRIFTVYGQYPALTIYNQYCVFNCLIMQN